MIICNEDRDTDYFLESAISLPLICCLQIALLLHTMYHECHQKRKRTKKSNPIKLRALYIMLQILGIYWTLNDLLMFVIDPNVTILGDVSCSVLTRLKKMIPGLYYFCYLLQILTRLEKSFKDTFLEMNKVTIYIFTALLCVSTIGNSILFLILNGETPCKHLWNPPDFTLSTHSYCTVTMSSNGDYILIFALIFIVVFNLLFAAIFIAKFNKLFAISHNANKRITMRFKSIIIKNSIMSLVGSISTFCAYTFWMINLFGVSAVYLYIDLLINCLVIGLMFSHNNKYYQSLCQCGTLSGLKKLF
eukprot:191045_1